VVYPHVHIYKNLTKCPLRRQTACFNYIFPLVPMRLHPYQHENPNLTTYPTFTPYDTPIMATTLLKHVGQSILPLAPSPLKLNLSLANSPIPRSVLYPKHSRGPVAVPVGTRTGDSRIRVSLSNQGGPTKVPGWVKFRNQNANPERVFH
jgi:hypothetical protein